MFDASSTERLATLLSPELPRCVGAYRTPHGYAFLFEWFDGVCFAAVEPLGVVIAVPRSRRLPGRLHVS